MNITPGYDFFSTEIPTRAKLGLMASGMSVYNIGLAQVDNAILSMSVTDGSVQTLPFEGWLWVDARSNIWGRTRHGNVIVRKSEGGWESNRYPHLNETVRPPGEMMEFLPFIAGNTNESNVRVRGSSGGDSTGAAWDVGVNQETIASTATAAPFHPRIVYRGTTRMYGPVFAPVGAGAPRVRCIRQSASASTWIFLDLDDFHLAGAYGESNQGDPDSNVSDYIQGYFYPMVPD